PVAEVAILHPTTKRNDSRGPEPIAGREERIPGARRIVRVESCAVEERLVERDAVAIRVEAGAILLALEDAHLGGTGPLQHIASDEAIERLEIAPPDILHVVDAIPQIL